MPRSHDVRSVGQSRGDDVFGGKMVFVQKHFKRARARAWWVSTGGRFFCFLFWMESSMTKEVKVMKGLDDCRVEIREVIHACEFA